MAAPDRGGRHLTKEPSMRLTRPFAMLLATIALTAGWTGLASAQEFGQLLGKLGVLEDAFVVDYVAPK
jgi:hypothetical protein